MISGILLAAGASQRYGSDKLIVPMRNGTVMAVLAVRNLLSAVDLVIVVVRPDAKLLIEQLQQERLTIVPCDTAAQGMSESLKAGIRETAGAAGWIIALADMPFIHVKTIRSVSEHLREGASIVAPYYNGRRGHPVGFSRQHLAELQSLDGDRGAWSILERHAAQIQRLECHDPAIHIDVDTQADMRLYR